MLYQAIVFLPLIGAIVAGILSIRQQHMPAEIITVIGVCASFLLSCFAFYDVALMHNSITLEIARWINSGDFIANWTLRFDTLTVVMLIVVTSVSSCVHIYSIGYMHHDKSRARFMAYLSLFTFAMLMLVTADNLLQLFFGWEGVGVASYLLIGFWYHKPSAHKAAMKAFIVNRVGDFGFALGIFVIFYLFGSIQFDQIFANASELKNISISFLEIDMPALEVASILLFIGAMGKSAQLGLHTWLPDAMEDLLPYQRLFMLQLWSRLEFFSCAECLLLLNMRHLL